jgi:hypothetical protein
MEEFNKKIKSAIKGTVRTTRRYIRSLEETTAPERDFSKDDFAYPWLNSVCTSILKEGRAVRKPSYIWGMVHGAHLARNLGIQAISVIEFGVAGGNGLVAMESVAEKIEAIFEMRIDVFGFDTGKGLPKPQDYRDMPNLYLEAAFPMDVEKLKKRLKKARLHLGLVKDTVGDFICSGPPPIAFASIDLDYYSSTMEAFKVLEADAACLLPRVHCYFDDIMGFTNSEFNGERLAIAEFNNAHESRKISPIFGFKHFLPPRHANDEWVEKMYMAHLFEHPMYGQYDGLVRRPFSGGTKLRDGV